MDGAPANGERRLCRTVGDGVSLQHFDQGLVEGVGASLMTDSLYGGDELESALLFGRVIDPLARG